MESARVEETSDDMPSDLIYIQPVYEFTYTGPMNSRELLTKENRPFERLDRRLSVVLLPEGRNVDAIFRVSRSLSRQSALAVRRFVTVSSLFLSISSIPADLVASLPELRLDSIHSPSEPGRR